MTIPNGYLKLSTMEYPRYEGDIRAEHPEILDSQTGETFPCPDTYAPVYASPRPETNQALNQILPGTPVQIDGVWREVWNIVPIPTDVLAIIARRKRDELLVKTDWTQFKDIADTVSSAWAPYRQALRDIPAQEGFPQSVTWPVAPT